MSEYTKWVSMWGNAMSIAEHKAETYSKNITLRYPVYAPFDGSALRITFDNYCGTEAVTIDRVSLAVSAGDRDVEPDTVTDVTFGGQAAGLMPAGETLTSDEIPFAVKAGSFLTVSFYLRDYTLMRSATLVTGPLSKGFYSVGDVCSADTLPLNTTRSTNWFYFLNTIDVLTEKGNRALICYGDSITAQDWPDYLTLSLRDKGIRNISIIRRAASGTRILRQYECITYESYGLMGANRIPHELNAAGADAILIQQGINDIIHPVGTDVNPFRPMSDLPAIEELIAGMVFYINECRRKGLQVYLGTLLPIYGWRTYAPFREELKNEFNDWLRHTALSDGCIDFDAVVRDCDHPEAFAQGYDSGDHLHPSQAAYQAMGEAASQFLAGRFS
ncbi:MAG: lipase [Lachnospiraceae bacterium]|nr:lipase [Lachnospiraceae bacterium]